MPENTGSQSGDRSTYLSSYIFFNKLEETGYTWVRDEEEGKWVRYKAGTEPSIPVVPDYYGPGSDIKLIAKEHLKTAWVWDLKENELRFVGNVSYGIVHGTIGTVWSPDGKKIMYVRMPPKYWWSPYIDNSDEGADIWVVDIDGSNKKQVTAIPENWEEGFWSLDGKRIVYASLKPGFMDVGETREIEVRMVNEDGGDERLLTTITTELIVRMVWSPDGSKIAVVTWEYEEGVNRDIYVIDMPATEDVKNENYT